MVNLPLILRCPVGGESWPATSYKCLIETNTEVLQYRNIHISCPGNHYFSLRKAVNNRMFTEEQAHEVRETAKKATADFKVNKTKLSIKEEE